MDVLPNALSALFATFASEFSGKTTTTFFDLFTPQSFARGALRALLLAAVGCRGCAMGGASE